MEFIKKNIGYLIALSGLGFFLYAFNLNNPLFWDDMDWIVNNPVVHAWTWENIKFIFTHDALAGIGQVSNYYRPFLFLTFMGNYMLSETSPGLYHLVNNVLHIGNSILIFYLLSRWLKRPWTAFLAALLFSIHPLQTEAITITSGRGDPLSVFFVLLGITAFLVLRDKARYWLAYAVGSGAMVLAFLSRETTVLFPVYLGVILMAFENQGRFLIRFKKSFMTILPFLGIAIIYGVLRLTVLNFQNTLNFYQQQNIYSEHISYRIYTFFHALIVYIRLIIWPTGLHMDRDIPVSLHIWDAWSWLSPLVMLGLLILLVVFYRRDNKASFNVWFFGLGIFFVNLLPTSGIAPINARIYEHWLYFSLFGAFAITSFYADKLWEFLKSKSITARQLFIFILVIYCLFLSVQTIRRNLLWGDTEAFYLDILSYEPHDVRVLNNLGNWYSEHNNDVAAMPFYQRAIDTDPAQPAPYYNLGNIARDNGDLAQAEALYKKSIDVDPKFHYAYGNLAQIYVNQNKLSQALAQLKTLQTIYPTAQNKQNIEILEKMIGQ